MFDLLAQKTNIFNGKCLLGNFLHGKCLFPNILTSACFVVRVFLVENIALGGKFLGKYDWCNLIPGNKFLKILLKFVLFLVDCADYCCCSTICNSLHFKRIPMLYSLYQVHLIMITVMFNSDNFNFHPYPKNVNFHSTILSFFFVNSMTEIFPPVSFNFARGASMILKPVDYLVQMGFVVSYSTYLPFHFLLSGDD